KVRLYNKEGDHYFIPFMFMLNLLSHYRRIPKKDFLVFIHSIPPTLNDQQLNDLIQKYSDVANGKMNFNEFIDRYLDNQILANVVDDVQKLLSSDNIDQDEFNKYFVNGKSTDSAGPIYLSFVKALINFRSKPTVARMKELVKHGSRDKIKKAFGFGKNPFKFSKKREYTLDEFIDDNSDNNLINTSLGNIFVVFRNSKRDDLVHEYGDMTYRLTNLAGVISYSNNIVSLPLRPVFEKIFTSYDISMSGSENYKDFDLNFGSALYQQSTFLESLRLSDNQIDSVLKLVARAMGLDNYQEIAKEVEKQNNLRFEKLVRNKFPKTTVLELLQQFVSRKDDLIAKTVTDNAPIADIFEYVLGLAWYYI
ncbi:AlwI family type II restriction endonuclease, partial [Lactiplantibacillus plantarum]